MLRVTGAAALGLAGFPLGWTTAAEKKPQKVLYFTRSAGDTSIRSCIVRPAS